LYADEVLNMSKDIEFKNRDRFIQLGITISTLRRLHGMSQEELAERAMMSRSHLSAIEAPNIVRPFSVEILFNISDALGVEPSELLGMSVVPDSILSKKKKD
jgi:transcriptional regulator with XRE-family HTH domain